MKRFALTIAALLSTGLGLAAPAPGTYQLDKAHSKFVFEVGHLVFSSVEGRFKQFDGTITLGPKANQVDVKVEAQVDSIDTDEPKRDSHLKSPDFFDLEKHPKLTFVSKKVEGDLGKNFKIFGDLTIRGVTKSVVFEAQFLGQATDPWGVTHYAYKANTLIDRAEYGLVWNKMVTEGPVVGDQVTIRLTLELVQAK
ncbi:MAG: hypothetical protein A2600_14215 [Candidatus Lambdaproteobacteria bacterium RIFOXYD1_FULL_56_27]|uniref:Lipid/polyisoprenoid-binding YceI-like domain-containing protein n=1 Tax=Candidatus Lambdaproteobacteria bacterium RIFOXYD2_FULL_56_26 TaxID=1817773 RepID=A0A1F6GTR9_9PROT|nr:MAG: hypothetical protein A2426_03555 [Candidatus Lambdaproteobacteria bacterium RIFOXYC1_FULL_56_13]OGH01484.1 MAG: hypothetical protein A2557_04490 [Candidatus Lambdaproteobacteria bacterium RIFOXYD2_FULL_56_26]OGH06714.1 MAG: hypothetical protein A2600_14215 [Candidatus Lambdaproteobacteria bacterium RIFOXYD1_FULL_56_27]